MSIVQSITSSIVYKILNVITVFIINIWLSRLAGAEGLGILSFTIATLSVYNLVSSLGLDTSITYNIAAKRISSEKVVSVIAAIVVLQIAVGFLIDQLSHNFFSYHKTNYFFISMILLISISLTEKFSALLQGQNLFKPLNAALFFSNLFSVIVLGVIWSFNFQLPIIWVLKIFIALMFCQSLSLIILYHSYFPFRFTFSFLKADEFKIFFGYAMITFITNSVQFMAYRIDYWLIAYYLRNESLLGLYAQAVKLSQLFWVMPLFLASVIFPVVARNKDCRDKERLLSLIRIMNVINLIGCIVLFLIADWLMPFLFGTQFAGSSSPFKLLLPGIFLFTNAIIISAYFAGIKKLKVDMIGSIVCLLTVLILDIILIPRYGINGASVATTISYFLTTIYFIFFFVRTTNSSLMDLFLVKKQDFISITELCKSSKS